MFHATLSWTICYQQFIVRKGNSLHAFVENEGLTLLPIFYYENSRTINSILGEIRLILFDDTNYIQQ